MKITDNDFTINKILNVKYGSLRQNSISNIGRINDAFVYILGGNAEYNFDGDKFLVEAGDIIYLAKKSKYKFNVLNNDYSFLYIDFLFENPENIVFQNCVYKSPKLSLLKSKFETLKRFWDIGNFSEKIYCKSLIYDIYSEIAKMELSLYVTKDKRKEFEKIAEYISDNLDKADLSVAELSKMCNISEVHFRRIFNRIYHTSPIKFITMLRLNKAKDLLHNVNLPISEVSTLCGFENQYYFSKIFKAENKLTPSEYRKLHRSDY